MLYKEMNYTQKREFEATLTIGQRAKMRRMEKEFAAQIQPINYASHAREEEVRKEAWKALQISERVKELEAAAHPQIFSLREQIQTLQEQLTKAQNELAEARSDIQAEQYSAAYNDPEVKAIKAIWSKTREIQAQKFQQLVDSFEVKVLA